MPLKWHPLIQLGGALRCPLPLWPCDERKLDEVKSTSNVARDSHSAGMIMIRLLPLIRSDH